MNFYAGSSVQKEKETEGESGSGNETDSVQVCFTYLDFVQFFFCEVFSAVSFAVVVQHVLQCVVLCHAHKNNRVCELFTIYIKTCTWNI